MKFVSILMIGLLASFRLAGAADASNKYKLIPDPAYLQPGESAAIAVNDASITSFTDLTAASGSGVMCDKDKKTCTAPAAPAAGLAVTGLVTITAKFKDSSGADQTATTNIELTGAAEAPIRGPWEARLVVGYHQAGAASSDFKQNVIMDFYLVRPLTKADTVWRSSLNTWGNVRIASAPRQLNTPFLNLAASLLTPTSTNNPLSTNVNELALAGEFQTGVEWNLTPGENWCGKVHGIIAFFGATGAFQPPDKTVSIFATPAVTAGQWPLFHERFPSVPASAPGAPQYVAFVVPDRDRFYRQWGVGYRYSRYNPKATYEAPQTYSATIGQDEAITGGQLDGPVLRVDGFYPLPVSKQNGRYKFLYVFATATLRVSKGDDKTPLILQQAPDGTTKDAAGNLIPAVHAYDPNVMVISQGSNRDNYRLGIGVDLVNLLRSLFNP